MSAFASFDRGSMLTYLDVILVVLVAAPAIALGAPAVGYLVGACAWIGLRVATQIAERRVIEGSDYRRKIGLGVAFAMGRVWILAATIMIVGLSVSSADGLTCALVIFGSFSVNFACSAYAHVSQRRSAGS